MKVTESGKSKIFEKQFSDNSFGFRPKRSTHDASSEKTWKKREKGKSRWFTFGNAWNKCKSGGKRGFYDLCSAKYPIALKGCPKRRRGL